MTRRRTWSWVYCDRCGMGYATRVVGPTGRLPKRVGDRCGDQSRDPEAAPCAGHVRLVIQDMASLRQVLALQDKPASTVEAVP